MDKNKSATSKDIHTLIVEALLGSPLPKWAVGDSNALFYLEKSIGTRFLSLLQSGVFEQEYVNVKHIIEHNRLQALTSPVKWIRDWAQVLTWIDRDKGHNVQ